MYVHKSGAQKRKEKRKRDDNERKGLQTLFQFGIKKVKMILKYAQMQIWLKWKVTKGKATLVTKTVVAEVSHKLMKRQI